MGFSVFCALDQMRFEPPAVALKRESIFRQTGVQAVGLEIGGFLRAFAPLVAQGSSPP